jgi:hypothetical protein
VYRAPVFLNVVNNQWAISVPRERQTASATIAQKAHADGSTLKQAALELGYLSEEEFDAAVVPERMV